MAIFGPCVVDFTKSTWECDNAYIGNTRDTRTFRVCPAVLGYADSREVVELLEIAADNNPNEQSWFDSPPSSIKPNSCMTVRRIS